ncbi:hypothetical protein CRE_09255 [Caenorhabditis remanei]|uniref:Uncharacterized protein n=1 Tax=Caenorhabditis remanei TaxID=31234 RepID=E3LHT3_CAERE|nr:hypothetical protein CRE_09255 [Caenorhabditis remanei]
MIYSLLFAYFVPIHYSFGTTELTMVLVIDKPLPRFLVRFSISILWAVFGATQSIYAVHFIYR